MSTSSIPRAVRNNLVVTLQKKFYDEVTFGSGITLYVDPSWHPEEFAMLEATVVSVPGKITRRPDYEGMTLYMQPGDKLLVRYDLVASHKDQPDRATPVYKNMLYLEGKEYWMCDIQKVFAIVRGDETIMVNGYVMCDAIEQLNPDYSDIIIRPDNQKITLRKDKMIVRHISKPLTSQPTLQIAPGDTIYCNPGVVQQYEINLKKYWIIKQSHILGVQSIQTG